MIADIFIWVLFAGSIWFAYVCGKTGCQKNGCYRGKYEGTTKKNNNE